MRTSYAAAVYRRLTLGVLLVASPAAAAVGDWRLNEVLTAGPGNDGSVRFVELYTGVDACWFPSTRLDVYDPNGNAIDAIAPFSSTTCFAAGTYLVLATSGAASQYGFTPDVTMVPALPVNAGQLCFASSSTNYDCVRWGAIAVPVHDFLGATDDTSAIAPPGGISLARTQVTHVVADDWATESPTPRAPNDGTVWIPPDAGPPDASIDARADGGPPDAVVDARPRADAASHPDAEDHRYLELDPGGGACSCRTGAAGGAIPIAIVVLALFFPTDRRVTRRRSK